MNLGILTPEKFRQAIAGMAGKTPNLSAAEDIDVRDATVRFTTILASLFGEDLDRLTLWSRIGTALQVAVARSGIEIETFVNICLEHIKADYGMVAASEPLALMLSQIEARPQDWKRAFLRHMERRHFVVLLHARSRWQDVKAGKVEL